MFSLYLLDDKGNTKGIGSMLRFLSINNVVLIDKLDWSLDSGLSVLTGETGAGKSILLDSLGLALGARSERGLIRGDNDKCSVTAEFDLSPDHPVYSILRENDIEVSSDEPLILRRSVHDGGYSKAYLNDEPIGVRLLKRIGNTLVEIHGQFENHGLMNPAVHKDLVDSFGCLQQEKQIVKDSYYAWVEAKTALKEFEDKLAKAKEEEEYLTHNVDELEKLAPVEGEELELAERRKILMNAEKNIGTIKDAYAALNKYGEPNARVREAENYLVRAGDDSLSGLIDRLSKLGDELSEVSYEVEQLVYGFENPAADLEVTEERLFALRGVARKHQCHVDELPALLEKMQSELSAITHGDEALAGYQAAEKAARAAYVNAATVLHDQRVEAASQMASQVMMELPPLKLEKARFVVDVEKQDQEHWHADGMDKVLFTVSMNPGSDLVPLYKTASGGELARLMLALKVILSKLSPVPVMVFDEVDTGISGATAAAVGERLRKLSSDVQVLVITHSPQVGAVGQHHFKVKKYDENDQTFTTVTPLSDDDRLYEIARLLSADEITDVSLEAARQLLGK